MIKRFFYSFLIATLISSLAIGAEVRKLGSNDLELHVTDNGPAETTVSAGGKTVSKISGGNFVWDNSYTRTIRPLNVTGNGSGTISGFSIPLYLTETLSMYDAITAWTDVRAYGVVGDGTTDDTTAFGNAIAGITDGGTLFIPADFTIKVTDGFYIRKNINIIGSGSTSRIIQHGTSWATSSVLLYYQSPTQTTFTSTATIMAGDTTLTLNDVTGLVTGTEMFLQLGTATYDNTQPYLCMFNTIASISGNDVAFSVPIPEGISGTSHKAILLSKIVQGVTIANISLEADSAAQPDQAMYIERCRNVRVQNVMMNHTGGIINAQSENVWLENIYYKRARFYGAYAASGNMIGGWGFRNYYIKNVFGEDIDHNGIYFEAMGRGASIENFVYNVGAGKTSSGYGLWVGGDCKGVYLKNGHFNAPYANYFGIYVVENSEVRTEDVFLYNGTSSLYFMKYHRGMLGWDRDTGAMEYYEKIKQYTIKITMDNSTSTTYTLPSGIYKQVRAYTDNAAQVTGLHFKYGGTTILDAYASLQTDNTVDLSSVSGGALTSLGTTANYPFNNTLGHTLQVYTGSAAAGKKLIINIEYYAITNDANFGMIQDTY